MRGLEDLRERVERVGRALDVERRAARLDALQAGMEGRVEGLTVPFVRELAWLTRVLRLWRDLRAAADAADADTAGLRALEKRVRSAERIDVLREEEDLFDAFVRVRGPEPRWVDALFKMYEGWARLAGYEVVVHDDQRDDGPEHPSVLFAVRGDFAYGRLADENGVHALSEFRGRGAEESLARIAAVVEVWVDAPWAAALPLSAAELRIDIATRPRSRITAWPDRRYVAITHLPTGLTVRGEGTVAMAVLRSRFLAPRARRDADAGADAVREYAREPRPLVRDPRTGVETRDVDAVLSGEIDAFLEACHRRRTPGNMPRE